MDLIKEYNKQLERQKHITGVAMKVFNKSMDRVYSEWYKRDNDEIEKVKLM